MEENGKERKAQRGEESVCPLTVLKGRDEFGMVLGSQPMPFSFYNRIHESHFPCQSSTITRLRETRPKGWKGNQVSFVWSAIFEAVGTGVFSTSGYH